MEFSFRPLTEADLPMLHEWLQRAPMLEFLLVVVGALLALALDDWRDNRERSERDVEILALVAAELDANQSELREKSRYHEAMLEPIAASTRTMAESNRFALPGSWEGVRPIVLTRTAFDLAVMSDVLARVPAETALTLSRAYERLELAERGQNNVSLATLQTAFNDGVRYLRLQEEGVRVELDNARMLLPLFEAAADAVSRQLDAR